VSRVLGLSGYEKSECMGEENIKEDKWTSGIWRIRTNQELCELYKCLFIAADIKT
jgi:hypothetical protein